MMEPKELDQLTRDVRLFRESVDLLKQFKCADSVDVFYHTEYHKTHYVSSDEIMKAIRGAMIDHVSTMIMKLHDSLLSRGVDVSTELPSELNAKEKFRDDN
jgi:hypothetical protein